MSCRFLQGFLDACRIISVHVVDNNVDLVNNISAQSLFDFFYSSSVAFVSKLNQKTGIIITVIYKIRGKNMKKTHTKDTLFLLAYNNGPGQRHSGLINRLLPLQFALTNDCPALPCKCR